MKLTVKYFALLREAIGTDTEAIEVPETVRTVADLQAWLIETDAVRAKAFAGVKRIRAAVNASMAPAGTALADGDEVAFFPPVTGG